MQQEVFPVFALERIDDLLVLAGAERRSHETLGLAPREQRGTVRARQNADFGLNRPNGLQVAAIDTLLGIENSIADDVFFHRLEHAFSTFLNVFVIVGEGFHGRFLGGANLFDAGLLDRFPVSVAQTVFGRRTHSGQQFILISRRFR